MSSTHRMLLPDEFPHFPVNCRFGTSIGGKVKMANPECIPVNPAEPTPFETRLFKGTVMMCIKDAPGETNPWGDGERFAPKKRRVVVTVQGKFKQALAYSELQCGLVWKKNLVNLPWPFVLNSLQTAICAFSPGTEADLKAKEEPHFVNCMLAGVDTLHVRKAGEPGFDPRTAVTPEHSHYDTPQARMKDAGKKAKAAKGALWGEGAWDTDTEYTFDFFGDKIDLAKFVVMIPGFPNIELSKYFNGQPFPFIAKTASGEILWHFEIWHAQCFTTPGVHPGSVFSPLHSDMGDVDADTDVDAESQPQPAGTPASVMTLSARTAPHGVGGSMAGSHAVRDHIPESNASTHGGAATSFASCVTDHARPLQLHGLTLPFGQGYDYEQDAPISEPVGDVGLYTPIGTPGDAALPHWQYAISRTVTNHSTPRSQVAGNHVRTNSFGGTGTPSARNLPGAKRGFGKDRAGGRGGRGGLGGRAPGDEDESPRRILGRLHLQDRWSQWDDHLAGASQPRPNDSFCATMVLLSVIGVLVFVGICYQDTIFPRVRRAFATWPQTGQLWGLSAACVGAVLLVAYLIGKVTEFIRATDKVDFKFGWWEAFLCLIALGLAIPEEIVFRAVLIPILSPAGDDVTDAHPFVRGHDNYLTSLAPGQIKDALLWMFLSVFLFVGHLPLLATTLFPIGYPTLLDPRLLAIATVVGFGCALAYLITASLWPSVIINAMSMTVWLLGMGGMKRFRRVRIRLPPSGRGAHVPYLPLHRAARMIESSDDDDESPTGV